MFIADSHCDTLSGMRHGRKLDDLMINRDKMLSGGLCMQTFALFTGSKGVHGTAYQDGIDTLAQREKLGIPIFNASLPETAPEYPCGVISIEGGEALEGKLERLYEFYSIAGIRMIALTWNFENEIASPAKLGDKPGLKPFGFSLLKEMDKLKIYADVSHLNEAGFWDVYNNMELPPIASHSNNKELCNVPRNLDRAQIKAIIERKGYIGINFYTAFLTDKPSSTFEDVYRHIDSIMELGGEDVLGFGSDFDGIDVWPEGLYDASCYPRLIEYLLSRGYDERIVEKLAGLNLWQLLKKADLARCYQ
ncbi:MAG: dipeptidase [Clostridiales bacterium]|nr:dipeptidase [Clostridiales bacterium]